MPVYAEANLAIGALKEPASALGPTSAVVFGRLLPDFLHLLAVSDIQVRNTHQINGNLNQLSNPSVEQVAQLCVRGGLIEARHIQHLLVFHVSTATRRTTEACQSQ
jgi:hypothetical protein